uniref:cytochrome c oxidase subunit II n=1 Tax=Paravarcia deceptrix TaxID=1200249 RepID=UPI002A840ECF|nr:cytochrome c oxidase subunit II [Paravarcia deceptrix]WOW99102.1 cytochrome c oxidase subunit II [Paravarcia deceptrix]
MSSWMKMNLINSASPMMEQLTILHEYSMMFIVSISSIVMFTMMNTSIMSLSNRNLTENQPIELAWTIMPAIVLIFIALPSLKTLYLMEEMINPTITIKAMGHQWYWTYEYSDKKKMEMESYMAKENSKNEIRLIDTDNRLIMPFLTQIRMIISSSDVIHSWTIPSIGVKMDAIPGRLNQVPLSIKKPGMFFGQCSEICGTNHSFMPISIESIKMNKFIEWMKKN